MWTATLIRAEKDHGRLTIEISYVDLETGEVVNKSYNLDNPTKKKIRDLARSEVNRLEALKNEVIDIPVGTSIDITPDPTVPPDPPPDPTPEELARTAWFGDWDKFNQFLRLVNAGLMDSADIKITNLRASLSANWLNSYLDGV